MHVFSAAGAEKEVLGRHKCISDFSLVSLCPFCSFPFPCWLLVFFFLISLARSLSFYSSCCPSLYFYPSLCTPFSPSAHIFPVCVMWDFMQYWVKPPISSSSKTGQSQSCSSERPHSSVRLTRCVARCVLLHCTVCVFLNMCVCHLQDGGMNADLSGWENDRNGGKQRPGELALLLLGLHN